MFLSDVNMTAKSKVNPKSIFLKRHQRSEEENQPSDNVNHFKFNFSLPPHKEDNSVDEEPSEDLAQVERFKFIKSDNNFRFNFSL